ncbi:MAG TPA: class I SAM-dependent methyltransferase [Thermoanaerobaculia bacterium]|jgi:SAM-dependent methyltransferase
MRLDPEEWARVHDRPEPRHFAFRRGLALCLEKCGPRIQPGALWADVGSGTGHLSHALAERGARVVGLDLDTAMSLYAHRRWQQPFAVSAAGSLALRDGACAGVVAISLLGCLPGPRDLSGFLSQAARALAPGGTLCLSAMNRRSLLLAINKTWSWPARLKSGRYIAYDPASLADALRQAGFVLEEQIFYGHFLAAGRLVLPHPEAAIRKEHAAAPGSQDPWARQILLLARRAE